MHSDQNPTLDTLNAALPFIADAPKDDVAIDTLCFRTGFGERSYPESIDVTPQDGIVGERWAQHPWMRLPDGSGDPRIQVSILSKRVFDTVVQGRLHPGDTIIADLDTSAANMPAGQLLQIGTAVLRVSDAFNDGCVKWKTRYSRDAKDWIVMHPELKLRGLLCEIVEAGTIKATDRIVKRA